MSQIQIILSKQRFGDFETGVLGFWNSALSPILIIANTLTIVLVPRLSSLGKSKEGERILLVNSFNWKLTLVLFPIFGVMMILIDQYPNLFDFIIGSEYLTIKYWPIIIFIGFNILNVILWTPITAYFQSSEKRVLYTTLISFVNFASAISFWFILIQNFGIIGIALGLAIGSLFGNLTANIILFFITKGQIGYHIFVVIGFSFLLCIELLIIEYSFIWALSSWIIISLPGLIYTLYNLIVDYKNRKRYTNISKAT